MRRVILATVASVVLVLLAAASSLARTGIAVSPTNTIMVFPEFEVETLGTPVRCGVGLDITLHSRTSKVVGTLAGLVELSFNTNACVDGNMGQLVGGRRVTGYWGPYHMTYLGFSGTLPTISAVTWRINDVVLWTRSGDVDCLTDGPGDIDVRSTGGNPVRELEASGSFPLTGDFLCDFASGSVYGSASTSQAVTLTLF